MVVPAAAARPSRLPTPQAEEQLTALAAAKEGLEQLLTEEKAVALLQQTRLAEEQANADRLSAELATTQESLKCTENDLAAAREQLRVTAEQLAASQQMEKDTAAQLCTTREALETSQAELAHERTLVTAARAKIAELEGTEIAHEEERRRLHNTIQELKGNIRVFARVRPLLEASTDTTAEAEDADYAATGGLTLAIPSNDPEHRRLTLLGPARDTVVGDRGEAKSWDFQFDRVFGPHASQEDVFRDISQLVQSVLDGYKVCLFAYGQTGSGKTWTMGTGSPEAEEHRGMIPRAVAQIFATMEAMKEGGWKFDGAHVYNETLRDLLASESSSGDCTARTLDIKHGREGNTTVAGLSKHEIASAEDVNGLLRRAARARATGATHSNAHSSRSHSVFQLHVPCDSARGESRRGCLTMVDLAGSERLDKSGAEGGRLKETQAINKSLSALGDVIFALANGERHVPYRNSKLTYLLQHSLGGDSKVLMLVNVSPEPQHQAETLCSLRFAHKVNSCEIGSARTHKRHA
ncbi:putative kinesin family protein [Tribonema minus]|uniref:Putative kinesin family protein n=1 Tax=Tribonema minus TaxID=303371 RepID=A0A836CBI5_9STRA|nr:putative kinesin family protein [Tribonema minus]